MLLSDVDIKRGLFNGSILISPFREEQLGNVSYDLTVGENFVLFKNPPRGSKHRSTEETNIKEPWEAMKHFDDDKGVWLLPHERILAHTREFAGGTGKLFNPNPENQQDPLVVTSYIQATSTAARIGLTACLCAGWGDVGYCNRWTLEVFNTSPNRVYLPVGACIAQICFETVRAPEKIYGKDVGNYQFGEISLEALEKAWNPKDCMLPKKLKVYR